MTVFDSCSATLAVDARELEEVDSVRFAAPAPERFGVPAVARFDFAPDRADDLLPPDPPERPDDEDLGAGSTPLPHDDVREPIARPRLRSDEPLDQCFLVVSPV